MLSVALGAIALLIVYAAFRARSLGPLLADDHLIELASKVPALKEQALPSAAPDGGDPPTGGAAATTSKISVAYTIAHRDDEWVHHLSLSTPVTPARAAGTFFLALLQAQLGLLGARFEAFVSQNHVFHLVAHLTPEQHRKFVEAPVSTPDVQALRQLAISGRAVLLPVLKEQNVPAGLLADGPG